MPIEAKCPGCGRVLNAPDKAAGKRVKCPSCATAVPVPVPGTAGGAAARPAQPALRPAAPKRPPTPPPRRPPQPAPISGVADLIHEEIVKEVTQRRSDELSAFENQQQAAIRSVYEAPKLKALEARSRNIHERFKATKLDLGATVSRAWELFTANLMLAMGVAWFASLMSALVMAIVVGVAFVPARAVGVAAAIALDDPIFGVIANLAVLFVALLLSAPFVLWLWAGQTRIFLLLARGEPAEFMDVFRGGRYIMPLFAAVLTYGFIQFMPLLPTLVASLVVRFAEIPEQFHGPISIGATILSLILSLVAIYFLFKYGLYRWVVVDKGAGGGEALALSKLAMTGNTLSMIGLYLLMGLVISLGSLAVGIGLLFAYPFVEILLAVAYTDMTGQKPGRIIG